MRKFALVFLMLLAVCVPAHAQISALDSGTNSGNKTGASATMTYTVPSGTANRILMCSLGAADVNSVTVSGITWNGSSFDGMVPSSRINNDIIGWVEWWYKKNPTATASQNIAVTLSGSVAYNWSFGCITFDGVDQSTPFDATAVTGQGTSATVGTSITTATDGAQVLATSFINFAPDITPLLTTVYTFTSVGDLDAFASQRTNKATAGSQAATWTIDPSTGWVASTIALKPTGGGGGGGGGGTKTRCLTMIGVGGC